MTDKRRNILDKAEKYLSIFPVVALLGVRQCGKTTCAKMLRPNWKYYDLEKGSDYDFITSDFDFFFKENSKHIIFDEAQQSAQLFRELRGVIDKNRAQNGRFLLTGSSSPLLLKEITDSLAGRVGIIEVSPMMLNELNSYPVSNLYSIIRQGLSEETIPQLKIISPQFSYDQVLNKFLSGGYPYPVLKNDPEIFEIWMENYFMTYLQQDIRSKFPKLNDISYRRFISILSQLSGTIINKNEVGRTLNCSEVTVSQYLNIANGTFIWRNLPSFEKSISKSIVKRPRGHMRDSGLNCFLLGINNRERLISYPRAGNLFEAYVIEEIIGGLSATTETGWQPYYFRTKNGSEIDLILDGKFGTLPIEIKLGISNKRSDLRSLIRFVDDNELPLGIVINNSDEIKMLSEKIIQLPTGCL